ncbi:hypothetical protein VST7929_01201 [Vibrio stylophorae]|uniref:Protein TonB n=1 Tax=Vibrio stylophorae TaxID=659351 RepID=A0ABN8DU47_9VIBR|nr:TonB family protein [Vibrio stylophorae]CAH0533335.1 hypothetical protein VST7929_01201 [Vibrio stylophorae]
MQTELETSHCQLIRQQRHAWGYRWALAGLGASGFVLLLLLLMGWQINNDFQYQREPERIQFDVSMAAKDESMDLRQRHLPEPPPKIEPQAPVEMTEMMPIKPVMPSLKAPKPSNFSPNATVSVLANVAPGNSYTAPVNTGVAAIAVGQIQPSQRAIPMYPRQASRRGIEGYVKLGFSIDEDGRAVDIQVIEAQPRNIFNRSAIQALKRSRFPVTRLDEQAVVVPNQVQVYEYKLEK